MKVFSVSGGVDSVCGAHILRHTVRSLYHYNHKLRLRNDEMQKSVERFAKDFGMSLILKENRSTLKTEAEYRKARLDALFLDNTGIELHTAHHLDDCVESYLLNCLRGHPEYKPIQEQTDFGNGNIIFHPFLKRDKDFFKKYACKYNLMQYVVEDETNQISKGSRRNWIRNELIPLLDGQQIGIKKIVRKKFYA